MKQRTRDGKYQGNVPPLDATATPQARIAQARRGVSVPTEPKVTYKRRRGG